MQKYAVFLQGHTFILTSAAVKPLSDEEAAVIEELIKSSQAVITDEILHYMGG